MYKINQVDIGLLKLNDNNPRFIKDKDFESLVKSLKECPELFMARPLLCNKDLMILGGNMRFRAAQELEYKKVPVIVMHDLTPEQEHEVLIKDNGSWGQWDMDILANDFNHLPLKEWGAPIGWSDEDLDEGEPPITSSIVNLTIQFEDLAQYDMAKVEIQDLLERRYPSASIKEFK